jgi:hypothetical protein
MDLAIELAKCEVEAVRLAPDHLRDRIVTSLLAARADAVRTLGNSYLEDPIREAEVLEREVQNRKGRGL